MRNRLLKLSMGLIATATLAACGGGTGTTGSLPSGHTISAQFLDAAVSNLHYDSQHNIGNTDANGRFTCDIGDEVTFSIGKLTLGKSICQRIVTPQTISATITQTTAPQTVTNASGTVALSGGTTVQSTITKTAKPTDTAVTNRVRLLLSLDTDSDPTNGIQLPTPADQSKKLTQTSVDFKNTTGNIETELAAVTNDFSNGSPVTAIDAEAHFAKTLSNIANTATLPANTSTTPAPTPTPIGQFYNQDTGEFNESGLEKQHNEFNQATESQEGHQQEIQGR